MATIFWKKKIEKSSLFRRGILSLVEKYYITAFKKRGMDLGFLKVPSSVLLVHMFMSSDNSLLFKQADKEWFLMNLVVRRYIHVVHHRAEEIPFS